MTIATFDIGGTGVKFAALTLDGQLLARDQAPTPTSRVELLTWIASQLDRRSDWQGLALSVPGAVDQETGIIGGFSAVPYIHQVSWPQLLAAHQLPVALENDANCVGLSEFLVRPDLQNAACVVVGTGIGGAMIINGQLHRGRHHLGGEFGYQLLARPDEKLGNWSQLASTGSLVRFVKTRKQEQDWDGKRIYAAAAQGDAICQAAIARMNDYLALGLLNIQYQFDPDLILLGGSISQNPAFLAGVRERLSYYVGAYEEYHLLPELAACHYQADANLYGALVHWKQQWPA